MWCWLAVERKRWPRRSKFPNARCLHITGCCEHPRLSVVSGVVSQTRFQTPFCLQHGKARGGALLGRASGYAARPSSPGASCTWTSAFVLRFKVIKIRSSIGQWLFNNRLILRVFCCTAPSSYSRGFCWSYKASTLLVWKLVKACGRASSTECFQMLFCSFDYWKWFLHNPANFLFCTPPISGDC